MMHRRLQKSRTDERDATHPACAQKISSSAHDASTSTSAARSAESATAESMPSPQLSVCDQLHQMSDTIDFQHVHEADNRVASRFKGDEKESRLRISRCPRRGRLPVLGLQAVDQHGIRRVLDCLDHRIITWFGCTDMDWRWNFGPFIPIIPRVASRALGAPFG